MNLLLMGGVATSSRKLMICVWEAYMECYSILKLAIAVWMKGGWKLK